MAGDSIEPRGPVGIRRASARPFGLGLHKPRHFLEMARTAWDNRRHLAYAYRVLTRGVCDGCALGTTGLRDWTLEGTHLCLVRLNLLRLNTLDAFDAERVRDVAALRAFDGATLRSLGRIGVPLRRRRGEPGFTALPWEEALADLGARLRAVDPMRVATYMTSRGLTNEVYFAAQKAMRALGSPHIDNAARLCHSPSTAAMKRVLGVAASTCSYRDWYGSDLVLFFGSNPANDQPVAIKYLLEAKRLGTRALSINTYDEPGMRRYWVPSMPESALFGSHVIDQHYSVAAGGDLALIYAVQQRLFERGAVDERFIEEHTTGFDAYRAHVTSLSFEELVRRAGASRHAVDELASELAAAKSAVFVWSMGLTQHSHGTQTIEALCCLALSLGFVGREKTGLMPIRGHSGVQGGAEMGAYATAFPGGLAVDSEQADRLASLWGFRPPDRPGLAAPEMVAAAARGELDVLYSIGGNFLETLPAPEMVRSALASVPLRIHQDIVLSSQMLVEPADAVYILPARTRYEHRGGVTETTTERRVVYSPYVPGHEIPEAREEWRIPVELVRAARPELAGLLDYPDAEAIRADIATTIPAYARISELRARGDQFQWGGPRLCEGGRFPLPQGRARFVVADPPDRASVPGRFHLSTRRGKQFNTIVQNAVDPLTGAHRRHLLMHGKDIAALGLAPDAEVRVCSEHGEARARIFRAPIARGNVQMHWPEANVLLPAGIYDSGGGVPDYNVTVTVAALRGDLATPEGARDGAT